MGFANALPILRSLCLELSDTLAEVDLPSVVTNNFVSSFH